MDDATVDDEFDWTDIEQPRGKQKPTALLLLSKGANGALPARAYLTFKDEAAAWIAESKFHRIQIGGQNANYLRLVPETNGESARRRSADSKFRPHSVKRGATVLCVGIVTAWPDEARERVEATWRIVDGCMLLELPRNFAKPTAQPSVKTAPPKPEESKPSAAAVAKIVAERDELEERLLQEKGNRRKLADLIPKDIGGRSKLAPIERLALALLISRPLLTKEALMMATAPFGAEPDNRDERLADVTMSRLRPKLEHLSIPGLKVEIETDYGNGYFMKDAVRRALRKMWAPKLEHEALPV